MNRVGGLPGVFPTGQLRPEMRKRVSLPPRLRPGVAERRGGFMSTPGGS